MREAQKKRMMNNITALLGIGVLGKHKVMITALLGKHRVMIADLLFADPLDHLVGAAVEAADFTRTC